MATNADAPLDQLWKEYILAFRDFDDLTLARWLAQTLGQLAGNAWRLSHPLLAEIFRGQKIRHFDQRKVPCVLFPAPWRQIEYGDVTLSAQNQHCRISL